MLKINKLPNPLINPPWSECSPILPAEVLKIKPSEWIAPSEVVRNILVSRDIHIKRIAYLVHNKCNKPITVMRRKGLFLIRDGWHRLAAAIIREDELIGVNFI